MEHNLTKQQYLVLLQQSEDALDLIYQATAQNLVNSILLDPTKNKGIELEKRTERVFAQRHQLQKEIDFYQAKLKLEDFSL